MNTKSNFNNRQPAQRVENIGSPAEGPQAKPAVSLKDLPQEVVEDHIVSAAKALGDGTLMALGGTAKYMHAQVMRGTAVPLAMMLRQHIASSRVPSLPNDLAVQHSTEEVRPMSANLGESMYALRRLEQLFQLRGYNDSWSPVSHGPSRSETWSMVQIETALQMVLDGPEFGRLNFPDGLSEAFWNLSAKAMRPLLQWKDEELGRPNIFERNLDSIIDDIKSSAVSQNRYLIIDGSSFSTMPPIWLYARHVEFLGLARSSLQSLPGEMRQLDGLRTFTSQSCHELGESLFASLPVGLKEIRVPGAAIAHVSLDVLRLKNLEVLDLARCGVTSLPLSLQKLEKLKTLNLNGAIADDAMWEALRELRSLETLCLSNCSKMRLYDQTLMLENLKKLDLGRNGLEFVPPALAGLSQLKELNLASNQIERLGDSLDELYNLEILDLSRNRLEVFDVRANRLPHLAEVDLTYNRLQTVPPKVLLCSELKTLRLGYNAIHEVPNNLWAIKGLDLLDLSGNLIETISADISACLDLRVLNLEGNPIKELPAALGRLKKLETLRISSIDTDRIPEVVLELDSLQLLLISDNFSQGDVEEFEKKFKARGGRDAFEILWSGPSLRSR